MKKQKMIDLSNQRENKKRIPHTYKVNEKILLKRVKSTKHGEREYDGPYKILEVNSNGTVRVLKDYYSDLVNIRQVIPYFE